MKLGTVYISSRGLKKATKYDILPLDLDWKFTNDFCSISDIKLSECDPNTLLSLMTLSEI